MGLGLAIIVLLVIGIALGFMVVQALFAARKWRAVIAGGDRGALMELLDQTFEAWRTARPPKGMPPADWRALHTAALVAADRERIRVSMLAEPDVRVVGADRDEVANEYVVARRAAVRMVERLLYEVPHASFAAAQVDVSLEYRDAAGGDADALSADDDRAAGGSGAVGLEGRRAGRAAGRMGDGRRRGRRRARSGPRAADHGGRGGGGGRSGVGAAGLVAVSTSQGEASG